MADLKDTLLHAAVEAEDAFDALKFKLRERLGRVGPVMIQPFRGYGTETDWYLSGRVLKDKGIERATDADTLWQNLVAMYRRFESDEIPHATIRAQGAGAEVTVQADEEGLFDVHLHPRQELRQDTVWHDVDLRLTDDRLDEAPQATGTVLVPPVGTDFGVISDLDDTVIVTGATDLLQMLRTTFVMNARTRLPFEGVAAFYQALQQGPTGSNHNPCFYVSSSPWNLYDFLADFMDVHAIPFGPLFLRDLGLTRDQFIDASHDEHKLAQIEHLLTVYSEMRFILVGDSGQRDPEIYRQVVCDFPGRIEVVYVRDVTSRARDAEVHRIAEEVGEAGVEMVLVADTVEAAEDAVGRGIIRDDTLPDIRAEKAKDDAPE